jgi:preprotein translocase subunit SecY
MKTDDGKNISSVVGVGLDVTVVLSAVVPELVMLVVFTITYMKVLEYALLFYEKKMRKQKTYMSLKVIYVCLCDFIID